MFGPLFLVGILVEHFTSSSRFQNLFLPRQHVNAECWRPHSTMLYLLHGEALSYVPEAGASGIGRASPDALLQHQHGLNPRADWRTLYRVVG